MSPLAKKSNHKSSMRPVYNPSMKNGLKKVYIENKIGSGKEKVMHGQFLRDME